MKKNLICPLVLTISGLFSIVNIKTISTHAESVEPTVKDEIAYLEDFEDIEVGLDGEEIYQESCQHLLWTADSVYAELNANHQVEYLVQNVDSGGYSKIGAFGTGESHNLCGLIPGAKYTFSVKVDLTCVKEGSKIYFEYQNTEWTGAYLNSDGTVALLGNGSNAKYVDGVFSFDFVAQDECLIEGSEQYPYIKITGEKFDVGDKFCLDDFKIVRNRKNYVMNYDYESFAVDTDLSKTSNIWNNSMSSIKVAQDEDNNKYLALHKDGTEGVQQWGEFYFNRLSVEDNKQYRLSFDIVGEEGGFDEFYFRYNDNVYDCITLNTTGVVSIPEYEYFKGATFDGTHVTYDFVTSSAVNANFWQQTYIVIRNTGAIDFAIDNVTLELIDETSKPTFVCSEEINACLNDEDYLDDFFITYSLVYSDDDIRYLTSDELIVEETNVDIHTVGDYSVTLKVVDEYLNEYTKTVLVHVIDELQEYEISPEFEETTKYGLDLDIEGKEFVFTYASGKTERKAITADMISDFDKNTLGEQNIKIGYEEGDNSYSYSFYIEVVDYAKELNLTNPTKLVYEQGESLDLSGLKVEQVMASGKINELRSSSYKVSAFDSSTAGTKTITITAGELTKSFDVVVNEKKKEEESSSIKESTSESSSTIESSSTKESSTTKEEKKDSSSKVDDTKEEAKKGCGSATIPSMLGLLTLATTLILSKKRK